MYENVSGTKDISYEYPPKKESQKKKGGEQTDTLYIHVQHTLISGLEYWNHLLVVQTGTTTLYLVEVDLHTYESLSSPFEKKT